MTPYERYKQVKTKFNRHVVIIYTGDLYETFGFDAQRTATCGDLLQQNIDTPDGTMNYTCALAGSLKHVTDDLIELGHNVLIVSHDYNHTRRLTPLEIAMLSTDWENARVDVAHYKQNVWRVFEVDQAVYNALKYAGVICQQDSNKFYAAY